MPAPRLTWEAHILRLKNPFRLSYGVSDTRQTFILRLEDGEGVGEAAIPPYYGVRDEDMVAVWERAAESRLPFPEEPGQVEGWVGSEGPAPARCALELALYDRIALRQGVPLFTLLDLPQPQPRPTSFTIAIDTPEEMAHMASQIPDYPVIKVKLGSEDDEARLAAIRAVRPDVALRVDANAGWNRKHALVLVHELEKFNLEMIEQPLEKHDIEGLGLVQAQTSIPIVADESVQTAEDVERLAQAGVRGINLKLMKVGGLTPAVRMARRAVELGMHLMLGCMIETSIGTTAMAHLAGLADWFDLDAPLLTWNDPFEGIWYDERANFHLPERMGIGVLPRRVL